jgi:hypothetical protein
MYMNICQHIDASVRRMHGVKCYIDGDIENDVIQNVAYIHVCDILNILKCVTKNEVLPNILSPTTLFEEVPINMKNHLVHVMLTEYELKFLLDEIDYFYFSYAYHGNYSYLPIRTHVRNDCPVFTKSKFFTNNEDFVAHQNGKLSELNDNTPNVMSRIMFRSF